MIVPINVYLLRKKNIAKINILNEQFFDVLVVFLREKKLKKKC